MRRASTCLALLVAWPSLACRRRVGGARRSPSKRRPFPSRASPTPATSRRRRRRAVRMHDQRHRIRRRPPGAADRGQRVRAPRAPRFTGRVSDLLDPTALEAQGNTAIGTSACPKKSSDLPDRAPQPESPHTVRSKESYAFGNERFGKEVTEEKSRCQGFFAPGGKLCSSTPRARRPRVRIHLLGLTSATGGTPVDEDRVPLVETVPGAPDASVETINVTPAPPTRRARRRSTTRTVPKKGRARKAASR